MAATAKISEVLQTLETLAGATDDELQIDEATRSRLYDATRKFLFKIESDTETMQRIDYSPIQLAVIKLAYDVNLFECLVEQSAQTLDELALLTGVHPTLLSRILKFAAAHGLIAETGPDEYGPTKTTRALAMPGFRGAVVSHFSTTLRAASAMPSFLKATNYIDPSNPKHCALQHGLGRQETFFEYLAANPDISSSFNDYMSAVSMAPRLLGELYDFKTLWGANTNDTTVLFVDVGGGNGHQCLALRKSTDSILGRVILQDQAAVVKDLILDQVEVMAHDFFQLQPVKGAKAYYFRTILHDWSDADCLIILKHIHDAMDDESVILLDERIIATQDAHWIATNMDLAMMLILAAKERSEKQWEALLGSVGLRIKNVNRYSPSGQCMIEAVKIRPQTKISPVL